MVLKPKDGGISDGKEYSYISGITSLGKIKSAEQLIVANSLSGKFSDSGSEKWYNNENKVDGLTTSNFHVANNDTCLLKLSKKNGAKP